MRITHPGSFLIPLFLGSLALGMSTCSSTTSTTAPPVTPSGSLNPPAVVEFNSVGVGRWHDTTYSVANTFTDSIIITGSKFSTPSQSGSMVKDTIDYFPMPVPGGKSAILHAQYFAADSGSQSAVDTIQFKHAGTASSVAASVHARGVIMLPGAGSTFTFDTWSYDSLHSVAGAHRDSTFTILTRSASYAGKTNVIIVMSGTDTSYYHPESNGDISRIVNISKPGLFSLTPFWITMPVASHTTLVAPQKDSSVTISGLPCVVSDTVTSTWLRSESVATSIKSFNTEVVHVRLFLIVRFMGTTEQYALTNADIWYSPVLQMAIKSHEVNDFKGQAINSLDAKDEILTRYDLK